MDIGDFNFKTDFDKQCGEIFLTIKGKMMFHCTLCERIYKEYTEYADHVTRMHILESIEEADIVIGMNSISPTADDFSVGSDVFKSEEDKIMQDRIVMFDTMIDDEFPNRNRIMKENSDSELKQELYSDEFGQLDIAPKRRRRRKRNETAALRIHKCSFCDFTCNDKSNLASHVRRHSGEKRFKCNECSKQFYTSTELKTHHRTHTGERPYLCTTCGRSFKTSGILSDHVKRHKNIRTKECVICKSRFFNMDMLRKHIATHSDERPYKCNFCKAAFKQPNGLRNHRKIHENKREYQCHLCLMRFNQKPGLHSHMKNRHALKPPLSVQSCQVETNKDSND